MRHAVAPAENVENNYFAVTDLLKICTHCERLSKKVRERKGALGTDTTLSKHDAFKASTRRGIWTIVSFCLRLYATRSPLGANKLQCSLLCRLVYE